MICTGTGCAPMRAMTEWRRRLRKAGKFDGGKLMLFFGARTREELPYFGPLGNLPKDFIDINFAFSRAQASPSVTCRTRCASGRAISPPSSPTRTPISTSAASRRWRRASCALRDIAIEAGLDWETHRQALKREGRLHLETY